MYGYKIHLSLDIKEKLLFNGTKEKSEVLFLKIPMPYQYLVMIDSCPEGLVSGKANKWPKANRSLRARKQ